MAIKESPQKKLTLSEIYNYLQKKWVLHVGFAKIVLFYVDWSRILCCEANDLQSQIWIHAVR